MSREELTIEESFIAMSAFERARRRPWSKALTSALGNGTALAGVVLLAVVLGSARR